MKVVNEDMNNWKSEVKSLLTIVTPPSLYFPISGPKIFLAGSIDGGRAPQWQNQILKYIDRVWKENDVTVFNPRCDVKEFTSEMEIEQQAWNISMLEASDYILLHLAKSEGVSPSSLLELGIYMQSKKLYLSIDSDNPKKYVVEVHYNYFNGGMIYQKPEIAVDAIRENWLAKRN